jgi:hypothetical protein
LQALSSGTFVIVLQTKPTHTAASREPWQASGASQRGGFE